jgi:hypothetical protein
MLDDTRQVAAPGVAPRRQRGVQCNWSTAARTRAWLVIDSAMKQRCAACREAGKARKAEGDATWHPPAPDCTCKVDGCVIRSEYDRGRVKYADATHPDGEPLTDAHKDARARRLAAKLLLKLLWRESKRLREEATGVRLGLVLDGDSKRAVVVDELDDEGLEQLNETTWRVA